MPGWGDILQELNSTRDPATGMPDFDAVRRKYLLSLHRYTGRPTVLYASAWMTRGGQEVSITLQDMQGLMEVFRDVPGPEIDLILHSPGGSPEAADRLVRYMRSRFSDVRVFVPLAAMSAATMWSLASDRIVMGKHSQLGPIDPQLPTPQGMVPAAALLRQFDRAAEECTGDPARLSAWLPTLQQYWPGLLEMCRDAEALARELVETWVRTYMLASDPDAATKAHDIADFFAASELHKTHGRGIDRDQARAVGVIVDDLESDQALQDGVLSVHHATMHTLQMTGAVKLIENHLGRAYVVNAPQAIAIQMPAMPAPPGFPPGGALGPPIVIPTP